MTKWIRKFLSADKLHSLTGSALLSLGRLGATVAMARLASPADFASFVLLVTASVIALNLPMAAVLTPMINRAGGLDRPIREAMMGWTSRRLRRWWFWGTVLAALGWPIAASGGLSLWVYCGFAAAVLSGGEVLHHRSCLQVSFRTGRALLADGLGLLFTAAGVVMAVWIEGSLLGGFWWGTFGGQVLAIVVMRAGEQSTKVGAKMPPALARQAQRDGLFMLGGSLANSAGARLQPFVLAEWGNALTVASFGVAWTLVGPIRMLSGGLSTLLRPRLAVVAGRGDERAFNRMIWTAQLVLAGVGGCGTLIGLFWGPEVVALIFGESLRAAGYLVPLALLYGTIDAFTSTQMIALQVKLPGGAALATRYRLEAAVGSLLFLIPACIWGGATGAFGGLLAAEFGYALRAGLALRRGPPLSCKGGPDERFCIAIPSGTGKA